MKRAIYRNRPDWTTVLKYHNGSTEVFLHCGRCLSVIPNGSARCQHCAVRQEKQKVAFEAFIASKQSAEEFI
jgi:hypothetical protein